jgi:hypothetical protein
MPRNSNHHREATGPNERKIEVTAITNKNGRKLTTIEEIFLAVMGREMLPEERDVLLKLEPQHNKP